MEKIAKDPTEVFAKQLESDLKPLELTVLRLISLYSKAHKNQISGYEDNVEDTSFLSEVKASLSA